MIVLTTARVARYGRLARLAVLVLFALFMAHDAVYVARYGIGADYAAAMSTDGHGAYYLPASLIVGTVSVLVAALAILRLGRLSGLPAARHGQDGSVGTVGPSYLQELRFTWFRLFPAVVLLFTVQESAEAFLSGQAIPGLHVLFDDGSGLVLPILGIVTFLLASLGAAVRWRTRVLLARTRTTQQHARPAGRRVPAGWASLCAALAHEWMVDRRDAGRAPPQIAG